MLAHPHPAPRDAQGWSSAHVGAVLAEHYGLQVADIHWLGGEVDQNAAVSARDGCRYVVKIAPPAADVTRIRWQHELLDVIAAREPSLRVPRVVPSLAGADLVLVDPSGAGTRATTVHTWLPGRTFAELNRHSAELLGELGAAAARLVTVLPQDQPPTRAVTHHWDVLRAPEAVAAGVSAIDDPARLGQVERIVDWFRDVVDARAAALPRQVVHQDLNDHNVLAEPDSEGRHRLTGILDFGDALHTARVSELAVAVAYAMLRKADPLGAAAEVVAGYDRLVPVTDDELAVLYPMAAARLCVNAVTWTHRRATGNTADAYGELRMRHTWPAIAQLAQQPPALAEARLRHRVGRPRERASTITAALRREQMAPVWGPTDPTDATEPSGATGVLDAGQPRGAVLAGDLSTCRVTEARAAAEHAVLAGQQLTPRVDRRRRRTTAAGGASAAATLCLGTDVHGHIGPVRAPLGGTVVGVHDLLDVDTSASPTPAVITRHLLADGEQVWVRWSGLRPSVAADDELSAGDTLGDCVESGGPLTIALFADRDAALLAPAWGVAPASAPAWAEICPDPDALLGLARADPEQWDAARVVEVRERHFARSQRSYYERPMALVASDDVWLYDDLGRAYLDVMNNVAHVGHANKAVVAAISRQAGLLNTNSRFVYDGIARYADRLAALLPAPLDVVFLVCTGSEANDLAVRIARQVTGRPDVLVIDGAYHGNTAAVTDVSPDRYNGPGGRGRPAHTHEVEQPNRYRGRYGYGDPHAGARYAESVEREAHKLAAAGSPPAAFLAESMMGTAGSIELPPGYLAAAFDAVRASGGLCVSDEVQVGFGRLGDAFWGFETQGVVPDIVTMGKPMGNGHPLAAVATTSEIARRFDTGMKYFNTFGGNPVSCAAGLAVLDELERRGLQRSAQQVGARFADALRALRVRHPIIGDVRGRGLYLGVELVRDPESKEPAGAEARYVAERMKDEGVLTYPTGPGGNVLKMKPPLTFGDEHADIVVRVLDDVLSSDW